MKEEVLLGIGITILIVGLLFLIFVSITHVNLKKMTPMTGGGILDEVFGGEIEGGASASHGRNVLRRIDQTKKFLQERNKGGFMLTKPNCSAVNSYITSRRKSFDRPESTVTDSFGTSLPETTKAPAISQTGLNLDLSNSFKFNKT